LGEDRIRLVPGGVIADMTVKRLGLASMAPVSAADAAAGRVAIARIASINEKWY